MVVVDVGARRLIVLNGNSSDFSNGGATIALTLDSGIPDEAQVRVSYAGTAVKDASDAANALVAFDDSVVINGTADGTAPTLDECDGGWNCCEG